MLVSAHPSLSSLARRILEMNESEAYTRLLPGPQGYEPAEKLLAGISGEQLFAMPVGKPQAAQAALCGLWLWHDWLEPAHRLAQDLDDSTGSFWHAIMHRREGDFSNSQYWYARCMSHPVMAMVGARAAEMLGGQPADNRLLKMIWNGWRPQAFVDWIEAIHRSPSPEQLELALRLQHLEWRMLFDYCVREALSAASHN